MPVMHHPVVHQLQVYNVTTAASVRGGGEVVLAAGAVHSPQILKLSGIGPREELEQHGIDCQQDLPAVGQNLQVSRNDLRKEVRFLIDKKL